jgi:hypothetical protein
MDGDLTVSVEEFFESVRGTTEIRPLTKVSRNIIFHAS